MLRESVNSAPGRVLFVQVPVPALHWPARDGRYRTGCMCSCCSPMRCRSSLRAWRTMIMQRDMKVGLAVGLALIGVVGALFFRREPVNRDRDTPPPMKD